MQWSVIGWIEIKLSPTPTKFCTTVSLLLSTMYIVSPIAIASWLSLHLFILNGSPLTLKLIYLLLWDSKCTFITLYSIPYTITLSLRISKLLHLAPISREYFSSKVEDNTPGMISSFFISYSLITLSLQRVTKKEQLAELETLLISIISEPAFSCCLNRLPEDSGAR